MENTLDWSKYLEKAVEAVSEGIVMLKNGNNALPLDMNENVSVFGRIQLHYYKSGTGSGGMVNVSKVTGIVDGLLEAGVKLNEKLLEIYKKWDEENPFDQGEGWGNEPWSQKEMPLTDNIVEAASKESSRAIVIIGRTAGEEQDARLEEGSYLLSGAEKDMLKKVRKYFSKVIVLLNVGSLVDISDICEIGTDALLYVWQGGMTGGTGTAAVLTGKVSPSGKLPDTIAQKISDYPSDANFGQKDRSYYKEDIYVGYRWFETFAKEKVVYPFGFGLSYTTFDTEFLSVSGSETLTFSFKVTNTGKYTGKEVVQLYVEKPQGKLGQPARVLCSFAKTKALMSGESQELTICVNKKDISTYDDSGASGNVNCWVLEEGEYSFWAGSDVRKAEKVHTFEQSQTAVVEKCSQALAPVLEFERIKPRKTDTGFEAATEAVPTNRIDEEKRRKDKLPEDIEYTGDKGIKLSDVMNGNNTMTEFIAQLSDYDLSCIVRGEGMGSPRVTAGTASAFGGVSDKLNEMGVPACCCSDGPSGMRLDCGTKAFSLPNGTLIASTFNRELIQELYGFMGTEMVANKVDCLLGPGMNIHRHPLNGRNFEYFSEDPYLTGQMAAAELKGLHSVGVTGTIKHFCANNQETNRHFIDSAVSERALREIYLKGFEIAVKEGNASTIMTTYGSLNGLWTAGNYDLNTIILRDEWGFRGLTMTDWWANVNFRGEEPKRSYYIPMIRAQNDVYMVCADSSSVDEDILNALGNGTITRGELQRNAENVLRFAMTTHAMKRITGNDIKVKIINREEMDSSSDEPVVFYDVDRYLKIDLDDLESKKGENYAFALILKLLGWYKVTVTASSTQSSLAQLPITLFTLGTPSGTLTWNGTDGKPVSLSCSMPLFSRFSAIRIYFAQNGLKLHSIEFELEKEDDNIDLAFAAEEN
ncbi:MAG: glycoside hydrolase family 3 protein [Ruminococcus sp.]|uniref:glycoside hydrolase family 3 protein n=1 Tax=Ruminococcus sp. TaxID=41978 RepID=UPI0025CEF458|nr:glycoside hydrolase family 3 protein [Ruminococcus sp.]MBR5683680.1 glycoside hydrolase family 3 protein [Ruminococcus sp.]